MKGGTLQARGIAMNEESLFHEALALSSVEERSAFLDRACAGQPNMRAAVDSLLNAHLQDGSFLSGIVATLETDPQAAAPTDRSEPFARSTTLDADRQTASVAPGN